MHIHHGYIGIFLIFLSVTVIGFGFPIVGGYNPWLAWGGFLFGIGLLVHDVLWHLKHRKKR